MNTKTQAQPAVLTSGWLFVLIVITAFLAGYICADDNRIERENAAQINTKLADNK